MLGYRVEVEGAVADLAKVRGQVQRMAQKGLRKGVKDIAVPRARALAPHKTGELAASMRGTLTGLTGYIESRDPKAGLIEFGGTRKDHINPTGEKQAVTPAPGVAVRYVRTPRHYVGRHTMRAAALLSADQIGEITANAILDAFAEFFPTEHVSRVL